MSNEPKKSRSATAHVVSIVFAWVPALVIFLFAYLPISRSEYVSGLANFIVLPILLVLASVAAILTIYNVIRIVALRAPAGEDQESSSPAVISQQVPVSVEDSSLSDPERKGWPASPPGDIGATIGVLCLTIVFLAISNFFLTYASINTADETSNISATQTVLTSLAWVIWLAGLVWGILLLARKKKAWLAILGVCAGSAFTMMIAMSLIGRG